MDLFLFVENTTELSHMTRLSSELSMNMGGALSVVNLDKELPTRNITNKTSTFLNF
mgnify:CR=1 FL=1